LVREGWRRACVLWTSGLTNIMRGGQNSSCNFAEIWALRWVPNITIIEVRIR
jgi:hypothetical protein